MSVSISDLLHCASPEGLRDLRKQLEFLVLPWEAAEGPPTRAWYRKTGAGKVVAEINLDPGGFAEFRSRRVLGWKIELWRGCSALTDSMFLVRDDFESEKAMIDWAFGVIERRLPRMAADQGYELMPSEKDSILKRVAA